MGKDFGAVEILAGDDDVAARLAAFGGADDVGDVRAHADEDVQNGGASGVETDVFDH